MAVFNEPTQWDHELGNNADVSSLPDDTSATTGVASLQKLFQVINQTPLEAGGVAPEREDFNALFKILGDSVFYGMNGGVPSYNADYDYIAGRVVLYNGNLYKCIQANGASSTVVAPDSVSPLGSDYWVQVATLADFTNFANIDLSNLSASGQTIIDGKADKDFSNVTAPVQAFKDMSMGWDRPDWSSVITITKTNPNPYVAPSDGYMCVNIANSSVYTAIYVNSLQIANVGGSYNTNNNIFFAVSKGDKIVYNNPNSAPAGPINSYFIPCKGAN